MHSSRILQIMVAVLEMTSRDRLLMSVMFDHLDADEDGFLSEHERTQFQNLQGIENVLRCLAVDANGKCSKQAWLDAFAQCWNLSWREIWSAGLRQINPDGAVRMSDEDVSMMDKLFSHLDSDGDGHLSIDEFKKSSPQTMDWQVGKILFGFLDNNKDEKISRDEWILGYSAMWVPDVRETMHKLHTELTTPSDKFPMWIHVALACAITFLIFKQLQARK